ncbi:MAG: DUF3820 family protein [Candidatus Colwellbacteria bacterium]
MSFQQDTQKIPIVTVGRYAGNKIDTLPNSYLRWMVTQDFPKLWIDFAIKKLKASDYNDNHLNVTRHAIDMFSKRFLKLWVDAEGSKGEGAVGLATFITSLAQEAWDKGEDISKHRHQDDGVVKLHGDIKWVYSFNPSYPDYKDVITVMSGLDQ